MNLSSQIQLLLDEGLVHSGWVKNQRLIIKIFSQNDD